MTEKAREGQRQFLIEIAKRSRTAKKMARIGVALKILLTLVLGYADVVTDFLVAKSYYDAGESGTAQATAGFAILAIVLQAVMTFFQYAKKPWKEQGGRTLAALLGLGPLIEGLSVWTGKEDPDVMLSGPMIYATMKGIEIAFESIPECVIQLRGLFKAKAGDIQTIQIIGVVSSIVSGAFIMTGERVRGAKRCTETVCLLNIDVHFQFFCNVAIANFFTVSNVMDNSSFAPRFACSRRKLRFHPQQVLGHSWRP